MPSIVAGYGAAVAAPDEHEPDGRIGSRVDRSSDLDIGELDRFVVGPAHDEAVSGGVRRERGDWARRQVGGESQRLGLVLDRPFAVGGVVLGPFAEDAGEVDGVFGATVGDGGVARFEQHRLVGVAGGVARHRVGARATRRAGAGRVAT